MSKMLSTVFRHIRKCNSKAVYDWFIFIYKSFFFTSFAKLMEFNTILNYLEVQEGDKVCDLGCGDGRNDVLLALAGTQVYGVDIDRDVLNWARNNARRLQVNVNYCLSDLNNPMGYKSESFDKAVSNWVLHHLSEPEQFLKEVNKILRPKGILALSVDSFSYGNVPNELRNIHKKVCRVIRYYDRKEISLLLNECNFSVEKCSYIIRSPISSLLYKILLHTYFRSEIRRQSYSLNLFKLLTPIVLVISMISDSFCGDNKGGYCLTVCAVKEKEVT